MADIPSYIKKSRIMVALSVGLFFLGIYALVFIHSSHTDQMVEEAIEEAEHELKYFTTLVKEAYLEKDFVRVEKIFQLWARDNPLDHSIRAIAANGFELFSYVKDVPANHIRKVEANIMHNGRLLLNIVLERDIRNIVKHSEKLRENFLLVGLGLGVIFGGLIWILLYKYAFTPLELEISRRHRAEEELKNTNEALEQRVEARTADIKKLSGVVEQTDDIVVITDHKGIVEYINPSFTKITGYTVDDIIGKHLGAVSSGLHNETFYKKLWDTIRSGRSFRDVFINRKKNGDIYYEEKTITPLKEDDGEIKHFVSTGKDISDRIEFQEQLHHMATHDALTELPNRLMIKDRLTHAIEQAERKKSKIALMFLDLDRFKQVNDSLGHPIGDKLLQVIARNLKSHMRHGDTVGRLGGDEFTIIMEGLSELDEINMVAQKALDIISEPVLIRGYEIVSSASIGITVYPDDSPDADTLLKNADVAMYRAKSQGGKTFQFYTHDMSVQALERMDLHQKLNHALDRDEFMLYYQPRIDLRTGQACGMEALLRWNHPKLGMVSPMTFIPILEETGQIVEVGYWVFDQACRFNAALQKQGFDPLRVSVNLSARQFHDEQLLKQLHEIQNSHCLDIRFLEVEITESLLIDDVKLALKVLDDLHKAGMHISIDDFGTGYSSMSYLKRFPINTLKIDRSFVMDIPHDQDDIAIVQAIIALGKSLGMNLIAEGVETAEQLQFFTEVDCDEIQGYFISKPLPENEFIDWLKKHNNKIQQIAGKNK